MPIETEITGDFVKVQPKPVTYEGFQYLGENPLVLDQPRFGGKVTAYREDWVLKIPNGRFIVVSKSTFEDEWMMVE